jgi:hypothetical protein
VCYNTFMSAEYSTGSTLSDRDLELASFWVRNRTLLRRVGYGTLIGIASILWAFVLWSLLDAYAISYPVESRIPRRILQNQNALAPLFLKGPAPLRPATSSPSLILMAVLMPLLKLKIAMTSGGRSLTMPSLSAANAPPPAADSFCQIAAAS